MKIKPEYFDAQFHIPDSWLKPADRKSAEPLESPCYMAEEDIGSGHAENASVMAATDAPSRVEQPESRPRAAMPGPDPPDYARRKRHRSGRPTHIDRHIDKTGRQRLYFRRRCGPRIPLRGEEGTSEFEASLAAAHRLDALLRRLPAPHDRPRRTLEGVARRYLESDRFATLAPATRAAYGRAIRRLIEHGALRGLPVQRVTRTHIRRLLMHKADKASAAADALKKLRILFRFAINLGWCREDPTIGFTPPACTTRYAWSTGEIAAFEARWPVGTRERLAFDLLRHDGLRGHQIIVLTISDLAQRSIPPALPLTRRVPGARSYAAIPCALATTRGRPFSAAGFGKFLARAIADAGLPPRCVSDSIRRSRSRTAGGR